MILSSPYRQRQCGAHKGSYSQRKGRSCRCLAVSRRLDDIGTQRRGYNDCVFVTAFYAPVRRNLKVVSGLTTSPFISSSG